jgi:hypothetical protein
VCVFSKKLKMACARNLKALIVLRLERWKLCWVFNYSTKFQTICFSLSPLTIHFFLKNQPFACLIVPWPNLHIADISKLGKRIKHAKGWLFRKKCKFAWIVKGLKLKQIVWNFAQELKNHYPVDSAIRPLYNRPLIIDK